MLFEKLLLNVGLVVLGLLAGIITVEVTLRLANYNPQISTDWQLEPSMRVLDSDLIMTLSLNDDDVFFLFIFKLN